MPAAAAAGQELTHPKENEGEKNCEDACSSRSRKAGQRRRGKEKAKLTSGGVQANAAGALPTNHSTGWGRVSSWDWAPTDLRQWVLEGALAVALRLAGPVPAAGAQAGRRGRQAGQ
jgi:hypothetical protein